MALMTKILLLILVAITLTVEAGLDDSPKMKMAFDGVMAAAPLGKDFEAAQAFLMEQQREIFAAIALAEKTRGKEKVVSLKGSYEKNADLVIAASPADKLKVMKKEHRGNICSMTFFSCRHASTRSQGVIIHVLRHLCHFSFRLFGVCTYVGS